MPTSIQLVALDLDGTLYNARQEISPANQAALTAVRDAGLQIVLATGRTRNAVRPVIDRLGLDTPGIYVQGLVTHNGDGSIRRQQYLDAEAAREVAMVIGEDVSLIAYSGTDTWVASRDRNIDLMVKYGEPAPQLCGSLAELAREVPINKFAALDVTNPARMNALRARLEQAFGERVQVLQPGLAIMVEVLPPGASKGAALGALLQDMEIAPEAVLACGDGENDIEMLELAGIGVAMGNANQAVRAAADFVSAHHNEDGVARALAHFLPHLTQDGAS